MKTDPASRNIGTTKAYASFVGSLPTLFFDFPRKMRGAKTRCTFAALILGCAVVYSATRPPAYTQHLQAPLSGRVHVAFAQVGTGNRTYDTTIKLPNGDTLYVHCYGMCPTPHRWWVFWKGSK